MNIFFKLIVPIVIILPLLIIFDTSYTKKIPGKNSIASLEKIELGGVKQTVLIRGENLDNPILIFVHGGPGYSSIPLITNINPQLEKNFIVVNWDQRGTGKSLFWGMSKKTVNRNSIEEDLYELIQLLKRRFNKKRVILAGHSWGSVIGLNTARNHPEDLIAYIGIGQVINSKRSDRLMYEFTLESAQKSKNSKAINELIKIDGSNINHSLTWKENYTIYKWLGYFEGGYKGRKDINNLNRLFVKSSEYSYIDLVRKRIGIGLSLLFLNSELDMVNFFDKDNNYDVPIFFCVGRYDYQTPSKLVEEYYATINSPLKKLIWFDNSAHYPLFEEPEKINNFLNNEIIPLTVE